MLEKLKEALSRREPAHIEDASQIPAAVLVPVYRQQGQYYILFTKRTETVRDHKGQISFPGGAYEPGDETLVDTALRESAEEIGLAAEGVELLGELDDISTASSYIVAPFVAAIPWPYQFKVDPREVAKIIKAPISALLKKDCLREETVVSRGEPLVTMAYNYNGDIIWGATYKILQQFLAIWSQAMKDAES